MMFPYVLFLVAFLQMDTAAPRPISGHKTLEDCAIAAREANKDESLKSPEAREMGLRFVCMTFVSET